MTAPRRRPPDFVQYDGLHCWHDSNGFPHSEDDQPAMIRPGGEKIYCLHGVTHRDFGPAHIHADGREEWYHHGRKLADHEIIAALRTARGPVLTAPRTAFRARKP